ncbi:D-alanyl-D-alanine carboxypeptidase [Kaistia terrae]|uniref:D-alanyl-D-alanine carboxypeptidase n=1 Tax=Kaistia terrae TaxID=537017 RepID=A0ABW0PZF6_9HYPH|nr:D-alanyl-D-alanine carboxypeptidase [Kaistia terrae]MCX5579044.1 D-alanyl-D-alanine carboxypeptidase [Kaistia terrae]
MAGLLVAGVTLTAVTVEAAAAPNSSIVVDAKTGKVLYSKEPDALRRPASLTKMMTLYVLFGELEAGRLTMSSRLKVSAFASRQSPTKLGLKPGSTIAVRDAMLGLITRSANDAAVVIAENISGSETAFAQRMTRTARSIGMSRTTFRNASGLPNNGMWSTARDMATLGRALQENYPRYYKYFSTRSFVYNGREIRGHNRLLGRVEGVDGIKTGYTNASGFNLVSSVKRDNRALVATVMGGNTGAARDKQMANLLEKYLPVAYAGPAKSRSLFARAKNVPAVEDDVEVEVAAVAPAPAPQARPIRAEPVVVAAAVAPIPARAPKAAPAPAPAPAQIADILDEEPVSMQAYAAEPIEPAAARGPRMVFQTGPAGKNLDRPGVKTASIIEPAPTADDDAGSVTGSIEASAAPATQISDGWKIQIAATPDEDGARLMLDRAKSKAGKMLSSATQSVEPVVKGSSTMYRARFAGFDNKDQARAVCAYLTKRDVSCLAIRQ